MEKEIRWIYWDEVFNPDTIAGVCPHNRGYVMTRKSGGWKKCVSCKKKFR